MDVSLLVSDGSCPLLNDREVSIQYSYRQLHSRFTLWSTDPCRRPLHSPRWRFLVNWNVRRPIFLVMNRCLRYILGTLSIVPELVTNCFDALVSVGRIQEYLESAEKKEIITKSPRIAMVDATIAWAADIDDERNRFCLRNINLEFLSGELNIVSGRTGSGKSLLLSALLGEADLISGRIEMPSPPNSEERFDSRAIPSNWVLPTAVAYVAQIPWIENGTIKDNILFGLPYNKSRYQRTLEACALEKDLEALTDGDATEIGANGINLSGGQRWRVSFARAAYSRAGILVLEDIFSAVDFHVGKQILENGLTGDLMHGRTRILVTHHLKLCLSHAAYTVILSNGTIENAGAVAELQQRDILDRIIAKVEGEAYETEEQIHEEELGLKRTTTRESTMSHRTSHAVDISTVLPKPRQFIQDEDRERGAVKWEIYKAYLKASGGYGFVTGYVPTSTDVITGFGCGRSSYSYLLYRKV